MREAFDAHREAARITQRRIADYLAANYPGAPWSDAALCYWYGELLKQRQRERERERLLAGLPSMPHARLRRLERWCDRLLEEGPNGPRGAQFYLADWLAPHVAAELERPERLAALKRTKVHGDRRPAPTLTGVDAPPPLLALVDAPENVTKSHTLAPMPVQSGDCVTVPQEAVQPAQDGPRAADGLITLWR